MRRYRLLGMAALLVLPMLLAPAPRFAAAQLPWINSAGGPVQQPFCPNGSQNGCFSQGMQTSGNATGSAAPYPYTPFEPCLQFMQVFFRMAAGQG